MAGRNPKQKTSSRSFKGDFSFVNKDARSIDSKEHNAVVSKHVTHKYGQWKRQLSVSSHDQSGDPFDSPTSSEVMSQQDQIFGSQPINNEHLIASPQPFHSAAATTLAEYDQHMTRQLLGKESSRPNSSTGAANVTSQSDHLAPLAHSIVPQEYLSRLSTVMYGYYADFDTGGHEDHISPARSASDYFVDGMLSSPVHKSVVSRPWPTEIVNMQNDNDSSRDWNSETTSSRGGFHNQQPSYPAQTPAATTESKSQRDPQKIRRQEQPSALLKAQLKQFLSEMVADNLAAARKHLKALKTSVAAQGGILFLETSFRANLLSGDCYFALKYGTRPVFPAQEWTPGPLNQHWKARLTSAGISIRSAEQNRVSGVTSIMNSTISHPKLRSILADLREVFETHEYVLNHGPPADVQLLWWAKLREFDCISRLADHSVDLAIYPHLHEKPKTQSLVVLAAALLANMVLGSPEPLRLGVKLLSELRATFTASQLELENGESNTEDEDGVRVKNTDRKRSLRLQLWILYVGTLAEKVHSTDEDHQHWFETRLNKLAENFEEHGRWSEMRRLVQPFLFSETLHQGVLANSGV